MQSRISSHHYIIAIQTISKGQNGCFQNWKQEQAYQRHPSLKDQATRYQTNQAGDKEDQEGSTGN